ncbi:hypothetical protein Hanom_Chr01g00046911 [Helianthus anomalus]
MPFNCADNTKIPFTLSSLDNIQRTTRALSQFNFSTSPIHLLHNLQLINIKPTPT